MILRDCLRILLTVDIFVAGAVIVGRYPTLSWTTVFFFFFFSKIHRITFPRTKLLHTKCYHAVMYIYGPYTQLYTRKVSPPRMLPTSGVALGLYFNIIICKKMIQLSHFNLQYNTMFKSGSVSYLLHRVAQIRSRAYYEIRDFFVCCRKYNENIYSVITHYSSFTVSPTHFSSSMSEDCLFFMM